MDLDNTTGNSQALANSNSNNNLTSNDPPPATAITTATTGNNCTMTTANVLKSNYDTDVVRLIGQHLIDMGLKQTVNLLLEETGLHGLDHPLASRFQQHILAGEWDQASSLVEELVNLVIATNQQQRQHPLAPVRANVDSATIQAQTAYCLSGDINRSSSCAANQLEFDRARCISEMRVAIAEQKFLELIEDRQHINALKCLRLEITPLCGDDIKIVKHLANLIMCKSTEEIRLKANWPGKGLQSRQMLVEKLQRYIPPLILLPLRRLSTLLNQAKQLQEERCLLHMKQDDDCNNESDDLSLASMSSTPTCGDIGSRNNGTNIATMNNDDAMHHSNGHISSSLVSASSSISANTSDNPARNEYFDLKQDHICPPDRFPLISRQELKSHRSEVWYCKFSNDGTKLATGGRGGKVKIWHVEPNEPKLVEKCTLDCNCNSITCLSWSPNDVYLISCSEDKPDLYIWDVNKEESHRMISHSDDESTTTCSWHLSGQKFAAASIKGNFNIYDLDGNRHGTREGVRVQCLQFLKKDPNYILAADTLNRIKSYAIKDMSLETEEEDILEEKNCIMSFTIDQDDKYIAVNVMEQGIHLWNFRLKTLLRTFAGVSQRSWTIYSSFSSPRAIFLASGSEDGIIYIYNITNNGSVFNEGPIAKLYGHQKCVNCVTWNPKFPHLLASVSDDRCVRLWAPSEKDCIASHIVSSNQTNLLNSASSVQCSH